MFRIRFHFTLILKNFIYSLFVQYLFFNFLSFSEYMPTTKSFYEIIFFFRKIYQSQQEHLQSNPYIATNNIIHSSMSHHTYYNFSFTLGSFVAVCVCGGDSTYWSLRLHCYFVLFQFFKNRCRNTTFVPKWHSHFHYVVLTFPLYEKSVGRENSVRWTAAIIFQSGKKGQLKGSRSAIYIQTHTHWHGTHSHAQTHTHTHACAASAYVCVFYIRKHNIKILLMNINTHAKAEHKIKNCVSICIYKNMRMYLLYIRIN